MVPREKEMAQLVQAAFDIEQEEAKEAKALGYAARILVLATMPHSRPEQLFFKRSNGKFRLKMVADPEYGLPYGSIARLVLAYISTEAIRTQMPVVNLGNSMSAFMNALGITPTGGEKGTIRQFKEHLQRLFTTSISFTFNDEEDGRWIERGFRIASGTFLWWDPFKLDAAKPIPSQVELSPNFFDELIAHPIPLDMRAIRALRKSPLAMDIYCWLTYRFYQLDKPVVISWKALMVQFGSNYSNKKDFRRKFLRQLRKVKEVYPQAQVEMVPYRGLKLWPSPTHVTPLH